jgi:Tfp pilus assembly protein PilN
MRQRINLYWPEFQPEFRWLNVGTMLAVWLLTLLIVVLVTMRLSATVQKQSAVLNQAQERTIQLDEDLAMAKSQLAERKPSEVLSEELETLNLSVSQKTLLIEELSGQETRKQMPFYQALNGFSDVADGSLWLTRFVVRSERLSLYGKVNDPGALPAWLKRLGNSTYFEEKEFEVIKLSRDIDKDVNPNGVLSFELLSELANEDGEVAPE